MDDRIAALSIRQFGLVTRRQLLELGLSSNAIVNRVRRGSLRVAHPGVYALPTVPRTFEQDLLAALFAAGERSTIAYRSAAFVWGSESLRAGVPDILVPHIRQISVEGVRVHRTRLLLPTDVVRRGPLRVTSPYRTIIDLAGVLSPPDLEDALEDFWRRNLVTVKGLRDRLEIRGRMGVPGAGALAALLDARDGKRASGSKMQSDFRRALRGLPKPEEEYDVYDATGRWIARVDFAYPDAKLFIEIDGWRHHSGRKRWELDSDRQNRLVLEGWLPLRFPKSALRDGSFRSRVAIALTGRGWQPRSGGKRLPVPEARARSASGRRTSRSRPPSSSAGTRPSRRWGRRPE